MMIGMEGRYLDPLSDSTSQLLYPTSSHRSLEHQV